MSCVSTSSKVICKLFLLLPLNILILLLLNKLEIKYNSLCNSFNRSNHLVKGTSQDSIVALLINAGVFELKGNTFCKEKLIFTLNNYMMNHCVNKNHAFRTNIHYFTIQLYLHALQPNKHRRYDNSAIAPASSA